MSAATGAADSPKSHSIYLYDGCTPVLCCFPDSVRHSQNNTLSNRFRLGAVTHRSVKFGSVCTALRAPARTVRYLLASWRTERPLPRASIVSPRFRHPGSWSGARLAPRGPLAFTIAAPPQPPRHGACGAGERAGRGGGARTVRGARRAQRSQLVLCGQLTSKF